MLRYVISILAFGLSGFATAGTSPATSAATGILPVGPEVGDHELSPFYRWTGQLPAKPGVLLREEALPDQPEMTAAAWGKRILYTSNDVRWRSGIVPVSGTLYLPKGQVPNGGWPLVAWAHGTLGVADRCAPSWAKHKPRDADYINRWLERGFAVVATDYQGLGGPGPHPYSKWEAEGRSVLDAVRAALARRTGELANRVIITGQSQGSRAALGATYLVPQYASEIELIATIATGVVAVFTNSPYAVPPHELGPLPASVATYRLLGGSIEDGGLPPERLVTDSGRILLATAREGCNAEMRFVIARNKIDLQKAFIDPGVILAHPALPASGQTPIPSSSFTIPVFLGTGLADTVAIPRLQYAAAKALCSGGTSVVWKTYPGSTHDDAVNDAFTDELLFVTTVLSGKKIRSDCRTLRDPGKPGPPRTG